MNERRRATYTEPMDVPRARQSKTVKIYSQAPIAPTDDSAGVVAATRPRNGVQRRRMPAPLRGDGELHREREGRRRANASSKFWPNPGSCRTAPGRRYPASAEQEHACQAAAPTLLQRSDARLPVEFPRICRRAEVHAAFGHGSRVGTLEQEQGRSRLRAQQLARQAPRADGVLSDLPWELRSGSCAPAIEFRNQGRFWPCLTRSAASERRRRTWLPPASGGGDMLIGGAFAHRSAPAPVCSRSPSVHCSLVTIRLVAAGRFPRTTSSFSTMTGSSSVEPRTATEGSAG